SGGGWSAAMIGSTASGSAGRTTASGSAWRTTTIGSAWRTTAAAASSDSVDVTGPSSAIAADFNHLALVAAMVFSDRPHRRHRHAAGDRAGCRLGFSDGNLDGVGLLDL